MNRVVAAIALGLGLLAFSTDAFADWTVVRSSGVVWLVAPDSTARAPVAGEVVPDAWMVATGPDGRVLLMRGTETITVSPSTQLVVNERGPTTQVLQPTGTVEFDVEVRGFRHFVVQTPVLAAVVKGTRFVVSTDGIRGSVRVERGAVEVEGLGTGQTVLVATGQEATVPGLYANLELRAEPDAPTPAADPVQPVADAGVGGGADLPAVVIETVEPVVETVTEIVAGATETVTTIVDEVLGGLGGLLGGLGHGDSDGSSDSSSSSSSSSSS